ncbi:MAG: hypothetical protein R3268_01640 [Acidiferrobacterales bacterium]|nr:hypothetical protein [Acidiferrobacterales bacterium]
MAEENTTIRNCRFAYRCENRWEDLAPTDSIGDSVRYCGECEQSVYLCVTEKQLMRAIRENRCVAIPTATRGQGRERRKPGSIPHLVGLPGNLPHEK